MYKSGAGQHRVAALTVALRVGRQLQGCTRLVVMLRPIALSAPSNANYTANIVTVYPLLGV